MGRHEDAVLLDETVWATQRRVLGEEHPDTLDTVESLAELYAPTEPARAEVLYKQAADGYRRTLGARHGNAILAVINLAQFWIDEKKLRKPNCCCGRNSTRWAVGKRETTRCTATA
jgi:hypothetical protein